MERIAAPVIADVIRRSPEFLSLAVFTITKKARAEKRKGTKEVIASALLTAKTEDIRRERAKRRIGKSKGVLLNITWPLIKDFTPNNIKIRSVTPPKSICLGRINESVVRVRTKNGKTRRRSPRRKSEAFSK